MYSTNRFVLAMVIAAAAVGCGKGSKTETDTTATAAPTPPPTHAPANTAAPEHDKKPAEHADKHEGDKKPGAEKVDKPTGGDAGFRWEVHKATNIKFEVPTNWTMSISGDRLVTKTPTPGAGLEFWGTEGKVSAKYDEKILLREVGKSLQKIKVTVKGKPVEQHGLKGHLTEGRGFRDGGEVEWLCAVLGNGNKEMLTLAFWSPAAAASYKEQMRKVLDSIGKND